MRRLPGPIRRETGALQAFLVRLIYFSLRRCTGMVIVAIDEAFDWTGLIPPPSISFPSADQIDSSFDDDQFILVEETTEAVGMPIDITLTGMVGTVSMSK